MQYKIYVDERDVNDATSYYIDIIRCSILESLGNVTVINKLSDIRRDDIVIVVKVTAYFRVKMLHPFQKVIIWIQGVQPEEMMMSNTFWAKKIIYYIILRLLEYFALYSAFKIVFVSSAMHLHYKKKYRYLKENYFIMPCFNLPLSKNAFYVASKYDTPNFVYAGSMDSWQCAQETILLFKDIKQFIPGATLAILTKQQEYAKRLIKEINVEDVMIKYVEKDKIQEEISKYKYGFILRQDIVVNNVATPTKINSYMSAGIIPIISESVYDFIRVTRDYKYIIRIKDIRDNKHNAKYISAFNDQIIEVDKIYKEYKTIFETYYNRDKYVADIAKWIIQ